RLPDAVQRAPRRDRVRAARAGRRVVAMRARHRRGGALRRALRRRCRVCAARAIARAARAPRIAGMKRAHAMPFAASRPADAGAGFRLWAPVRDRVELEFVRPVAGGSPAPGVSLEVAARIPMSRSAAGWHEADVPDAVAGSLYRYRLDHGLAVPDPASRFNPLDAHGPSELIDPLEHRWADAGWTGRPWHEAVVYEMHVGAFTPAGTFEAARQRLADLADLGITAIELMPVAEFPGARNWG